jgi:dTDP-glucose 4,6-dehydratase
LAASVPEAIGKTINLGSGSEISIGDLVQLISSMTNKKIQIESDEKRIRPDRSEVERLLADNTLAQELLGWRPTISLEDGLKLTIQWMQQHLGRYKPEVYAL